jgi:hypothetical protein
MRCKDALKAMHEVLDGEASEALRAELEAHTHQCEACAQACKRLLHWDAVLRAPEADEPDQPYFDAMARTIAAEVRTKAPSRPLIFRLSWSFASAMAAACLVMGLSVGHLAFPRTVTRTETVVERVPGPVREVERVVTQRVEVPVEVPVEVVRWRTRTIYKTAPAATARVHETALREPAPPPPPTTRAAGGSVAEAFHEAPAPTPVTTAPYRMRADTFYASFDGAVSRGYQPPGLTGDQISALARRLSDDMSKLDEALNAPRLASALVSDIESADAEIERAVAVDAEEAYSD